MGSIASGSDQQEVETMSAVRRSHRCSRRRTILRGRPRAKAKGNSTHSPRNPRRCTVASPTCQDGIGVRHFGPEG